MTKPTSQECVKQQIKKMSYKDVLVGHARTTRDIARTYNTSRLKGSRKDPKRYEVEPTKQERKQKLVYLSKRIVAHNF